VSVGRTIVPSIFSAETDDEVCSTLRYPAQVSAQLSENRSDESHRKMTTEVTL